MPFHLQLKKAKDNSRFRAEKRKGNERKDFLIIQTDISFLYIIVIFGLEVGVANTKAIYGLSVSLKHDYFANIVLQYTA